MMFDMERYGNAKESDACFKNGIAVGLVNVKGGRSREEHLSCTLNSRFFGLRRKDHSPERASQMVRQSVQF
jgi:hypothetical protein